MEAHVPTRHVVTGGPSVGKDEVFAELRRRGFQCSDDEIAREIYRRWKARLGRHLQVGDRREYAAEVLRAFIAEFCAHKNGVRFYDRGIPDGFGWEAFFNLNPSQELLEANSVYRYDRVFVLDQLDRFEDEHDTVWARDRDAVRVHQLIIQGYHNAGYKPIFVPVDFVERRVDFILSSI